MEHREALHIEGGYVIELLTPDGRLIERQHVRNQLTAINRDVRAQMLLGQYHHDRDALRIRYIAFGTGSTAATVNDTKLETEVFRKQATQLALISPGVVRTVVSLGEYEANVRIREIGVFGGPSAYRRADSGTLLSRAVVDIDKNSNIIVNIIRTDICTI